MQDQDMHIHFFDAQPYQDISAHDQQMRVAEWCQMQHEAHVASHGHPDVVPTAAEPPATAPQDSAHVAMEVRSSDSDTSVPNPTPPPRVDCNRNAPNTTAPRCNVRFFGHGCACADVDCAFSDRIVEKAIHLQAHQRPQPRLQGQWQYRAMHFSE